MRLRVENEVEGWKRDWGLINHIENFYTLILALIQLCEFFASSVGSDPNDAKTEWRQNSKCGPSLILLAPEGTAPWRNSANLNFSRKTRFFRYFSFKMFKLNHENNFLKYWVGKSIRFPELEICTWLLVWFRDSLYRLKEKFLSGLYSAIPLGFIFL